MARKTGSMSRMERGDSRRWPAANASDKPVRTVPRKGAAQLLSFFRQVRDAVSAPGSNHSHVVQIEPQTVSTLAVYRVVHERPLSVDLVNKLRSAAHRAGMFGWFHEVPVQDGRSGSLEFRFGGEARDLVEKVFAAVHKNAHKKGPGMAATYRYL
ncbi:MAG: hypothetical protein Q8P02_01795 [Candidatus Micrarchaeota archaeon]|nr:hypothetical protein [Candidatus Micrarchaeota archaeon]